MSNSSVSRSAPVPVSALQLQSTGELYNKLAKLISLDTATQFRDAWNQANAAKILSAGQKKTLADHWRNVKPFFGADALAVLGLMEELREGEQGALDGTYLCDSSHFMGRLERASNFDFEWSNAKRILPFAELKDLLTLCEQSGTSYLVAQVPKMRSDLGLPPLDVQSDPMDEESQPSAQPISQASTQSAPQPETQPASAHQPTTVPSPAPPPKFEYEEFMAVKNKMVDAARGDDPGEVEKLLSQSQDRFLDEHITELRDLAAAFGVMKKVDSQQKIAAFLANKTVAENTTASQQPAQSQSPTPASRNTTVHSPAPQAKFTDVEFREVKNKMLGAARGNQPGEVAKLLNENGDRFTDDHLKELKELAATLALIKKVDSQTAILNFLNNPS